jgi:hypothetical protein
MTIPVLKIKVTPKPSIKGKMDVRFPASVAATSPILLDKTGGNFTFSMDIDALEASLDPLYINKHLVVYTVVSSTASADDKKRADYIGDGANDQVAIQNAFAAAGSSSAAVMVLPGNYIFSDTCNIPAGVNLYFYSEGATFNGPGGTKDTFYSPSMIRCNYYFGTINHTGTGSAIHLVQFANGSWITAQSIHGSSRQGKGIYVDASTTGSSTSYIRLGWLDGFDKGLHFYSKTTIDTHVVWLNYGFNCHWVIYDETDVGASVQSNAMTWNVNLDTAWAGSAAGFSGIWTNGADHVINGTLGSTVGGIYGPNVKLDTAHGFAASGITLNLTPLRFAHESGNVVNSSGNADHIMNVGMPISLATGGYGNNLVKWSGGVTGQLDNTGISFGSIGTQYTIAYFSGTGVLASLATANNGVLVTNGSGIPSISTTLPNVTIPVLSSTTGNITTVNASTVNANNFNVAGATSGGVIIKSPAIAGSNTLTLPAGTTDFSATGGASRVVKQTSIGGAFTVAQLAASDLSNGTTGSGGGVVLATGGTLSNPIISGSGVNTGGALGFSAGTLNYGDGATNHVLVSTDQAVQVNGKISVLVASPASGGIGYQTGAGGTVTQATSKATGVTLNTSCGAVTMNAAALAAGTIVSFVLTDSAIAATDVLILNHISGGTPGSYSLNARAAAGSATIDVRNNTAGSLSEAVVIQFAVIKGVNA